MSPTVLKTLGKHQVNQSSKVWKPWSSSVLCIQAPLMVVRNWERTWSPCGWIDNDSHLSAGREPVFFFLMGLTTSVVFHNCKKRSRVLPHPKLKVQVFPREFYLSPLQRPGSILDWAPAGWSCSVFWLLRLSISHTDSHSKKFKERISWECFRLKTQCTCTILYVVLQL